MRKTADVVVIGGGAAGTSTAWHLAKLGAKNVVVVEQKYTPFGGTGRCAAQFRLQFASMENLRLALLSVQQFDTLGEDTEFTESLEISKHGYLITAYEEDRLPEMRRNVEIQRSLGIDSYVLDPKQCQEVSPYLNIEGMVGGSYCTGEGHINPMRMALAYKQAAQKMGVEFNNYTTVTGITVKNDEVKAVITDRGTIETPCVINAAGEYGKFIGRLAGITIPVEPSKHQILATEAFDYIKAPMIYSFKHSTYITQTIHGEFLMGWSDPDTRQGIIDFTPEWKFLEIMAAKAIEQVPMLANAKVVRHWAGQYGAAPDHTVIVGPVDQVKGFITALGCTKATMFAPAIGQLASEAALGLPTTLPIEDYQLYRFARGKLVYDPALL